MEATESAKHPGYVLVPISAIENFMTLVNSPPAPANFNPSEFLTEFEQACRIDYRLRRATIWERTRHAEKLLKFLDKHPIRATRQELRQFLMLNPAQNVVKTIRVLYGRFLGSDLAKCFKVPQSPQRVIIVPSREQLRQTYENLNDLELEAAFLLLASSGLRRHELLELTPTQIDLESRMITPHYSNEVVSQTKLQWITFFNDEAKSVLQELLCAKSPSPDERIFTFYKDTPTKKFKRASAASGFKITPQVLRDWFCNEMGRLGVQDRYVDAFCGRVPKKVLGRHYTDYSPERLKEIYENAKLRVFDHAMLEPAQTTLTTQKAMT